MNILVSAGGAGWAAHTERADGKIHTPALRDIVDDLVNMMPCPLCGKPFLLLTALSMHLPKHHQPRGHFENLMSCVLCGDEMPGSYAWTLHTDKHIKYISEDLTNNLQREHGAEENLSFRSTANTCPKPLAGKKRLEEGISRSLTKLNVKRETTRWVALSLELSCFGGR